jgi:hypothetical protein
MMMVMIIFMIMMRINMMASRPGGGVLVRIGEHPLILIAPAAPSHSQRTITIISPHTRTSEHAPLPLPRDQNMRFSNVGFHIPVHL